MTTFKEFMHSPHPELDKLATEAETARTTDEETIYETKENKPMRTFKAEAFKEPASDSQIRKIIVLNTKYRFSGVRYPDGHFFSKGDAIIIINTLMHLKDDAPKRDFDRDLYYRLYDRFAARYPDNHMTVPVRNYRTPGEDIPDEYEKPAQKTWTATNAELKHNISQHAVEQMLYKAFIEVK